MFVPKVLKKEFRDRLLEGYRVRFGKLFKITESGVWVYDYVPSQDGIPFKVGESFIMCSLQPWSEDSRVIQIEVLVGSRIRYILVDESHFSFGVPGDQIPQCRFFKELV